MKHYLCLFWATAITICACSNNTETSKNKTTETNDLANDNLFRDPINKIRIRYPESWVSIEGDAVHTVAKFVNRDSLISFSINVMPVNAESQTKPYSQSELALIKSELFRKLYLEKNVIPENFVITNSYIDNYPAVMMEWNYESKHLNQVVDFENFQIGCVKDRKNYMIALSIPLSYYSENFQIWFSRYLNSFRFE